MSYNPERCWADRDVVDLMCPLDVMNKNGCPGGLECTHRGSETHQCMNYVATPVGLCATCYGRIVPEETQCLV